MATQIESQTQLQEFLDVLKRRRWQVILPALIVLVIGVAFAVIVPKKYVAHTQVELRPVGVSISNKDGANAAPQIKAGNRILKVLKETQNEEFLALLPDEHAKFLERVITDTRVTTSGGGQSATFVNIEYVDTERAWAMKFLEALRDDWIDDVLKRDLNKAQDEARKLQDEKIKFERLLKDEEAQLTELRRVNNLSPTQPTPGSNSPREEDPLFARLKENEAERGSIELELPGLQSDLEFLRKRYDETPAKLTRENVLEAQTNENELRALELEITDLNGQMEGLKPAASKYRKLSEQLESARNRRDQLQRLVVKGTIETTTVDNPAREELLKQINQRELEIGRKKARLAGLVTVIEADSARVAEIHDVYREEREHVEKIGMLQKSLEDATLKYNSQARLVEQLTSPLANPFEITSRVFADNRPTEPNPWLIIAVALAAGLGLGISIAVVSEFSRSCFRSAADISRTMAIPVLGAISPILTRRERRTERVRRTIVGLSSLALILAIAFVTWAWSRDTQLLSQGLRDAIESLRSKLR